MNPVYLKQHITEKHIMRSVDETFLISSDRRELTKLGLIQACYVRDERTSFPECIVPTFLECEQSPQKHCPAWCYFCQKSFLQNDALKCIVQW